jgi:hypothetical protein
MDGTQPRGIHEGQLGQVDDNERAGASDQMLGEPPTGTSIQLPPQGNDATIVDGMRSDAKRLYHREAPALP